MFFNEITPFFNENKHFNLFKNIYIIINTIFLLSSTKTKYFPLDTECLQKYSW